MLCRTARRMIFLYRSDELSRAERLRMEKHLGRCSQCEAEAMAARRTRQMVAGLREHEPVLDDPESLTAGIMRVVESERQRVWRAQRRIHTPAATVRRIQLACGLALLLIVVAVVAQSYSDARRVYALERRLRGEDMTVVRSTTVLPERLRAEVLGVPGLLRLIEGVGLSNGGNQQRLINYIAMKYPKLASINLDDGIDKRERAILATEGESLVKELESIVRTGGTNNAK